MQIKFFEFNPVFVRTYVLFDETKEAAIIDCGAYTDEEQQRLKKFIDTNELKVKYLLNTHLHFDHILGNQFIYKTYGLKPQYHEMEELMPGLRKQTVVFGLPIDYEPVGAEHYIEDGDIISFGNIRLKALLTPGHSPGSLSFYSEENDCVFTGDVLFHHDIGRTDLWGGSEETLISSIQNKLLPLPENTEIYPGHGPSTTVKEEKQHNPKIKIIQ
ncbi:MBL fold hydrolase [Bacteroidia bacterium]|nr:MBL fold hydrolase [Bacteroidia bacterium]